MENAGKNRYNRGMWQWIKNQYHLVQSFLANAYFGFPSRKLTVIGVTGTSGKTTATHMIYEILKKAGYKVSLLSTVQAVVGGIQYDTGFHVTTPDPHILPKFLKQAVDNGDEYFVLEVSSHGLDQNRAAFMQFKVGVLTSLAHEHLDYHKTFDNYAKAKLKLLTASSHAVIPADGVVQKITHLSQFKLLSKKITTFGLTKGDQTQKKWNLKLLIPGDFMVLDGLAAASAASLLGVPIVTIKKALSEFKGIPGRFEEIKNNKGIRIVIDFAHKPDALEKAIAAARDLIPNENRVIVLFGCASQRDVLKRAMMGKISAELADVTILTDEDPRFEEPMKIINEIAAGCLVQGAKEIQPDSSRKDQRGIFVKIPNRKEAIDVAINTLAKKGDIVLLCGKGHEQSMNYKGKELSYSEHAAVRSALEKTA